MFLSSAANRTWRVKAQSSTWEQLLADPNTADRFQHLRDAGDWVKRDDVFIKYNDDRGHGPLSVGFGTPTNRFGPELQFGHAVGDAIDDPVLIIKCAWGGRALAVRFRPPSSGVGDYTQRNRKNKQIETVAEGDLRRGLS